MEVPAHNEDHLWAFLVLCPQLKVWTQAEFFLSKSHASNITNRRGCQARETKISIVLSNQYDIEIN